MIVTDARTVPVIVAIGEWVDRPTQAVEALEPLALMERALRACETDADCTMLDKVSLISLIGLVSWRYSNPVGLLCERLGIAPVEQVNASMGGDTPVRLVHEAAVRIARGEAVVAAIVGGEATHARGQARKQKVELPWTPAVAR